MRITVVGTVLIVAAVIVVASVIRAINDNQGGGPQQDPSQWNTNQRVKRDG